ncbi:MAG: SsrA-binding protein SmpB [Planctomycetaceae bacterium]|nr:SsrA-binding protein SmpB [Planctomycetaceae bacterium]
MAGKKSSGKSSEDSNSRIVCRNRRARHNFDILDEIECGIVLRGSEVKSIRDNQVNIEEAYARVENGEVWLHNADIAEYPQATYLNHERRRPRKLLLHRREIHKFAEGALQKGMTLVPLALSFSRGKVKVTLAVAKGRKSYDKRDKILKHEDQRTIRESMKRR